WKCQLDFCAGQAVLYQPAAEAFFRGRLELRPAALTPAISKLTRPSINTEPPVKPQSSTRRGQRTIFSRIRCQLMQHEGERGRNVGPKANGRPVQNDAPAVGLHIRIDLRRGQLAKIGALPIAAYQKVMRLGESSEPV